MRFLVHEVPAWPSNRCKRLVRGPKVHVADCSLAASLAGLCAEALERDRPLVGPLLESFVQGVEFYLGRATVPFGPHFTAVLLDALW